MTETDSPNQTNDRRILICTDLDRTLLPNGPQPESTGAREAFARLVARPNVALAFVSGRRKALQEEAIREFDLPIPDFAIADVGTSIYRIEEYNWRLVPEWHEQIGVSWNGRKAGEIAPLLADLSELRAQESEAQGPYKLSYFANANCDGVRLTAAVKSRLNDASIEANVIWSVDETEPIGLLDVLPARANKRLAVEFLINHLRLPRSRVVYAGDSGNDLEMFTSGIQSVLVANATPEFRAVAMAAVNTARTMTTFHNATGGIHGMNGNYSAGIIEGIAHFMPETRDWILS